MEGLFRTHVAVGVKVAGIGGGLVEVSDLRISVRAGSFAPGLSSFPGLPSLRVLLGLSVLLSVEVSLG